MFGHDFPRFLSAPARYSGLRTGRSRTALGSSAAALSGEGTLTTTGGECCAAARHPERLISVPSDAPHPQDTRGADAGAPGRRPAATGGGSKYYIDFSFKKRRAYMIMDGAWAHRRTVLVQRSQDSAPAPPNAVPEQDRVRRSLRGATSCAL